MCAWKEYFKVERMKIFTRLVLNIIYAIFNQYIEVCAEMQDLYFNAEKKKKWEFMSYVKHTDITIIPEYIKLISDMF